MIIAIGSNLHGEHGRNPLQNCEWALRQIAALPGLHRLVRSRWFSSAAWPDPAQPRYINGAVRAEAALSPADLLAALHRIEHAAGRRRGAPNAARTLDLDIIDMDGLVRQDPDPILPHPRAHQRAFVLYPLRDVAPHWVHPRLCQNLDTLIARLDPGDLHPQ